MFCWSRQPNALAKPPLLHILVHVTHLNKTGIISPSVPVQEALPLVLFSAPRLSFLSTVPPLYCLASRLPPHHHAPKCASRRDARVVDLAQFEHPVLLEGKLDPRGEVAASEAGTDVREHTVWRGDALD
jgi:hypothetical protein